MIFILGSILFNAALVVIFRYYKKHNVDLYPAIVINYFTCVCIGFIIRKDMIISFASQADTLWVFAGLTGLCFIIGFTLVGATVHHYGITLATVMQKMSLFIPALFGLLYFDEVLNLEKGTGFILATAAILLSNKKSETIILANERKWLWLLPAGTFLISGIIDSIFFYVQNEGYSSGVELIYTTMIFSVAALSGGIVLLVGLLRGNAKLTLRNFIGGIVLGLTNFLSIYFFLKMLDQGYEGSSIIPINNIGILLASAGFSIILFSEKLKHTRWVGLLLAVLAIIFLAYGEA